MTLITSEEIEGYSHYAIHLTNLLETNSWRPARTHIESSRNKLRNAASALLAAKAEIERLGKERIKH